MTQQQLSTSPSPSGADTPPVAPAAPDRLVAGAVRLHLRHLSLCILCLNLGKFIARGLALVIFFCYLLDDGNGFLRFLTRFDDKALIVLLALLMALLILWMLDAVLHHYTTRCRLRQDYLLSWLSCCCDQPLDLHPYDLHTLTVRQLGKSILSPAVCCLYLILIALLGFIFFVWLRGLLVGD